MLLFLGNSSMNMTFDESNHSVYIPSNWPLCRLKIMGLSTSHLIIVLLIVLVLFGAGKIPKIMGDLAKGVKAFKDGMKDEDKQ